MVLSPHEKVWVCRYMEDFPSQRVVYELHMSAGSLGCLLGRRCARLNAARAHLQNIAQGCLHADEGRLHVSGTARQEQEVGHFFLVVNYAERCLATRFHKGAQWSADV